MASDCIEHLNSSDVTFLNLNEAKVKYNHHHKPRTERQALRCGRSPRGRFRSNPASSGESKSSVNRPQSSGPKSSRRTTSNNNCNWFAVVGTHACGSHNTQHSGIFVAGQRGSICHHNKRQGGGLLLAWQGGRYWVAGPWSQRWGRGPRGGMKRENKVRWWRGETRQAREGKGNRCRRWRTEGWREEAREFNWAGNTTVNWQRFEPKIAPVVVP